MKKRSVTWNTTQSYLEEQSDILLKYNNKTLQAL